MDKKLEDRLLGCWLGLAVGDAVGTTNEFKRRDTYEHLTDMVGGGPFNLKRGQWTDDTSMAICLAESILYMDKIDAADLRHRWVQWWQHGHNGSTGRCFDIGSGTAQALRSGRSSGEGNGSIMRLAPVVLRWWQGGAALSKAAMQSNVTHGPKAQECAIHLAALLTYLVQSYDIQMIALKDDVADVRNTYDLQRDEVSSSGYCVHTLEAALWCLHNTSDFRNAVLLAANLGDDADTVAAVTGQLAGAKYGRSGIPQTWLSYLHDGDRLLAIGHKLIAAGQAG